MATNTHAELDTAFYLVEGGLDEFEPEAQRAGPQWLRAPSPTAADVRRWEPYVAPPRTRLWPFVIPVLLASVIAGGVVSWLGMLKAGESKAAERKAAAVVAAPAPRAEAAQVPQAPLQPALGDTMAPLDPAPAAPVPNAPRIDASIEQTLAAVSRSYRDLDAASLTAVWPGAASDSPEQAFSTLKYQTLSFDRCQSRPNGEASAVVSCEVSIAAAPKTGDPTLQRRRESWTIVMSRSGDQWTIAGTTRVPHP